MPREVLQVAFVMVALLLLFGTAVALSLFVYLGLASLLGRRLRQARKSQTREIGR